MPSRPRHKVVLPGYCYHAYARGNNKRKVFRDDDDYRTYMSFFLEAKEMFNIKILFYCLMPNHLHFIFAAGKQGISKFLHRVQMLYTRYFVKKYDYVGTIWQGRPKTKPIESEEYLLACGQYIENNPVRAGLARRPKDWPHSSYRARCLGSNDRVLT
ncbi:hypothetical protein A3C96_01635 [Candidatus Uhrbacteria bacterium RIFCSPHIGHO2_02_FULL_60_10]|uniref:Transposase IS200-like domain-containing protein n=1 Tax=Candidatus Uhrbacteria bacterium RIFCSPHIGHO2_02_FULL_60_10 TaxID=1802392 RepID=A0A1F7U5S0_9BACT|nr:MAG: hypothetical protein A3C96_01635 [Candidatus Uhrbacteria bacterium RIFCSPHIGHO2_02_FULL_60_10]